jgi:chromosomal replication initiation ATPase DnaA
VIRQLAFDLPSAQAMTRDHFFVAPSNALALQTVEDWQNWPGRKLLLLGPDGAGKTHLAQIWVVLADAVVLPAEALADADIGGFSGRAVVVEDVDRISTAGTVAEAQLFHLHNLATATGALMLTACTPPRDWELSLPDLISRLQATPIARLDPPEDALLSAVLVKLFADRQVAIPANLIPYLVSRMPRSVGAARSLVAALDSRALAAGRPITRALAGEVLDSLGAE